MVGKEEHWNKNLEHLMNGGFGDTTKPETLLNYWYAQKSAGYPYASENVKYFEEICGIERKPLGMPNENTCVCCGTTIPEGRQICPQCENKSAEGGGDEMSDRYSKICPFCGMVCENHKGGNLFCNCWAKYYWEDKVWLNRKTGEEVWDKEDTYETHTEN